MESPTPSRSPSIGTYSGGSKRKLSLALALVGRPSVVLLDEPGSGMDPVSRRSMWATVASATAGTTLVLTSHNMDEVEALCGRIGIMRKGELACLGTAQRLKSRFGGGYAVEVHPGLGRGREEVEGAVLEALGPCASLDDGDGEEEGGKGEGESEGGKGDGVLPEPPGGSTPPRRRRPRRRDGSRSGSRLHFRLRGSAEGSPVRLSEVFRALEGLKRVGGGGGGPGAKGSSQEAAAPMVAAYHVTQPTLEQVFAWIARGSTAAQAAAPA